MALPITPTPVIKGEDSRIFNQKLNENYNKRISKEERERGLQLLAIVLANSKL